jgi:hypothetical protein
LSVIYQGEIGLNTEWKIKAAEFPQITAVFGGDCNSITTEGFVVKAQISEVRAYIYYLAGSVRGS